MWHILNEIKLYNTYNLKICKVSNTSKMKRIESSSSLWDLWPEKQRIIYLCLQYPLNHHFIPPVILTFLLEADLNGDKILKENIVDMRIVQVEELLQLGRLRIF